ncbi:MAG TPA: hypothetical protein VFQ09_02865 [Rubrobacter sp.]|nr:hypothetical protein [Rubrobacter sp.]
MIWPVIQAASSPARNATSLAASSGCPILPEGNFGAISRFNSSVIQPVSVGPGLMAFTVIPLCPTSAASVLVNASMAPLVAT